MKLEVFSLIITTIETQIKKSYRAFESGVDLAGYDEGWVNIISLFFNAYYGKEGTDWIDWYLYERVQPNGTVLKAQDSEGNAISDINSLWNHVEKIRVSTDFVEFELPKKTKLSKKDITTFFPGSV